MAKELKDVIAELNLTAIYEEADEGGFIGYIAELPGANTQGETREETRANLAEAARLILSCQDSGVARTDL